MQLWLEHLYIAFAFPESVTSMFPHQVPVPQQPGFVLWNSVSQPAGPAWVYSLMLNTRWYFLSGALLTWNEGFKGGRTAHTF